MGSREKYAFASSGDCMGDLVPAGTILHAEPGEEIHPGDLVLIHFDLARPGPWAKFGKSIADDGHSAIAKILLSIYHVDGKPIGLFGQLNPPAIVPVPMSAVLAVDKVNFQGECTGLEREAMEVLKPFVMARVEQKEAA
jgi:hypothetical protein